MDACIGHDRAGRNRVRILLHDPLDQHAGCHRIYRPGAAQPAAGILKDENADQLAMSSLDKMLEWLPHTSREWIELIIMTVLLWLLMMAIFELELGSIS